jgi:NAD dependent epimerase/dehydratase family enzyme
MKLVLAGGSGHVGTLLARSFHGGGDEVVVLSRQPAGRPWRVVEWNARTAGAWAAELENAGAVINLAGRSVNCRYSPAHRQAILASRVESTRAIGEAIERAACPPRVWLQMSTATIYAHRYDGANDEIHGILGGSAPGAPGAPGNPGVPADWRFSVEVAKAWEGALASASAPRTRRVAMRTAMVMSPERGGIFDVLLGLVRKGLGGRAGDGRQFVSWIHEQDFIRAVRWLLAHEEMAGAVNLSSPEPLPYAAFLRILRESWGAPWGLPATRWMLAIGAFFLRTETELVLKSRRVVPARLLQSGFTFLYPAWPEAAQDLCTRWREDRKRRRAGLRDPGA